MLVVDHAPGLIQHLPTALPRQIAKVGVLQVERPEEFIEPPELEEFSAVKRRRTTASVEAWVKTINGGIHTMTDTQSAVFPPSLGQPGLLADLGRVTEEDLARYGKDLVVFETF
jgi:hypothetical protein